MGSAGSFAVLSETGVSSVPDSSVNCHIGVSPIAASGVTGFSLTRDAGGAFSTSNQVTGKVFAATYGDPTPASLTTAVLDMETAYNDAQGRVNPDFTNLLAGMFFYDLCKYFVLISPQVLLVVQLSSPVCTRYVS